MKEEDVTETRPSSRSDKEIIKENLRLRREVQRLNLQVAQLQRRQERQQNMQQQAQILGISHPSLHANSQKTPTSCSPSKRKQLQPEGSLILDDMPLQQSSSLDQEIEMTSASTTGLHHRTSLLSHNTGSQRRFLSGSSPTIHKSLKVDPDDDYDSDHVESQHLLSSSSSDPQHGDVWNQGNTLEDDNSMTFFGQVSDRAGWLVGLLVLQSMSSFILARNEALLQKHLVIIRFLTMLVGAGGNAGNQASVRVIRGLAIGAITDSNTKLVLNREVLMGLCLSIVIGIAGCIRAAVFLTPMLETIAITSSLFMIVMISIVLGAMMPLAMKHVGIDPAHSSTTIQVVMDILGVMITVHVSSLVLDSGFHDWFQSSRGIGMGA